MSEEEWDDEMQEVHIETHNGGLLLTVIVNEEPWPESYKFAINKEDVNSLKEFLRSRAF